MYMDYHHKDETVMKSSYLYNGDSYTCKTAFILQSPGPFQYKDRLSRHDSHYEYGTMFYIIEIIVRVRRHIYTETSPDNVCWILSYEWK